MRKGVMFPRKTIACPTESFPPDKSRKSFITAEN